ncbi:MAG: CDGSH iron-sulfur domain-containing protein [Bacteroidales bacterium]|nr:CDGSH iron-sulfur domain-containing protein [Bacteroidales bacterium]
MVAEARIMKNGPLVLKGDFTIIDADGKEIKHHKTSLLCRCGASKNPPFCDGTHSKTGYLGN